MKKLTLTAIGVLVLTAGSLLAHHSYGAFYDLRQTVILKGKVAKVSLWIGSISTSSEACPSS